MSDNQKPKRPEYQELVTALSALRKDIDDLVSESDGVAGLHKNGNVADWDSLLPGGEFGGWLASVQHADDVLARAEISPEPQSAPLTAEATADALECFWNAAISAAHNMQDSTTMAVACMLSEGFAAVATRLRENARG